MHPKMEAKSSNTCKQVENGEKQGSNGALGAYLVAHPVDKTFVV